MGYNVYPVEAFEKYGYSALLFPNSIFDRFTVETATIMPTRLPVKSTPSCGHWPVWYQSPAKSSRPGKSGTFAVDRSYFHRRCHRVSGKPGLWLRGAMLIGLLR
jgi:hypothetical protein